MTKHFETKDFVMDNPNFTWFSFGPFAWGSKRLKYITFPDTQHIIELKKGVAHEASMRLVPDTGAIIEMSGIWFNEHPIMEFEVTWLNVKPVVATIKASVGDEKNPSSFLKIFYYRDHRTAGEVWDNTRNLHGDKNARVLRADEKSVTIVRKIEEDILNDPDNYIDNVRYLKKVNGLHPDHNSRVEKWEINWK